MPSNIAKVQKKMSIYAKRRVRTVFFGNYGSVFKGRGMDFDDIRPYMYGDDVKDIDWKASARSRSPMIRRYVAIRKHNIMIIADSGRDMAALAPSGETKSAIATFCASVIAYIALKNDDLVAMTFGNSNGNTRFPLKEGQKHIENFLNKYEKSISLESSSSNINALLTYVSKNFRERMFLIIITDVAGAAGVSMEILRHLRVRHEQMCIMIEDSALTNPAIKDGDVRDISENLRLSQFMRKNKKLAKAETKMREELRNATVHNLRTLGICSCCVDGTENAIPQIFKMLEEQKHARR
jgi:uncharacterized protein (DUF58 family)